MRYRRLLRWGYIALPILFGVLFAAPTVICRTSIGSFLVSRIATNFGLRLEIGRVDIGWFTPLHLEDVELRPPESTNRYQIRGVDSDLTLLSLFDSSGSGLSLLVLRGVQIDCTIEPERWNILDDFRGLGGEEATPTPRRRIQLQEAALNIIDAPTREQWRLARLNIDVTVEASQVDANFSGVLTDPQAESGSFSGRFESASPDPVVAGNHVAGPSWKLRIGGKHLPLLTASPIRRITRAKLGPKSELPSYADGAIQIQCSESGAVTTSFQTLRITGSISKLAESTPWLKGHQFALLNGAFEVKPPEPGRTVSAGSNAFNELAFHDLQVESNLGQLQLDGILRRPGQWSDLLQNPTSLVDVVSGRLHADVDLAELFDLAPKLLPLRDGTSLSKGTLSLDVRTFPKGKRDRLHVRLSAQDIHARVPGELVPVQPVVLDLALSEKDDVLFLDRLDIKSIFGNVEAEGDPRSGTAHVVFDVDKLQAEWRTLFDLDWPTMKGEVSADLKWEKRDELEPGHNGGTNYRLTGDYRLRDLWVNNLDAHAFHQSWVAGELEIDTAWRGGRLERILGGSTAIKGPGIAATLQIPIDASRHGGPESLPLQLDASGTLVDTLPGLPAWSRPILRSPLGVELQMEAGLSREGLEVTQVQLDWGAPMERPAFQLTSSGSEIPKFSAFSALGSLAIPNEANAPPNHQWISQQFGMLHFVGQWQPAMGRLEPTEFAIKGTAWNAQVHGSLDADNADVSIRFDGDLASIQRELEHQFARLIKSKRGDKKNAQFDAVEADIQLEGRVEGAIHISRDEQQQLFIESTTKAPQWSVTRRLRQEPVARLARADGLNQRSKREESAAVGHAVHTEPSDASLGASQPFSDVVTTVAWNEPRSELSISARFNDLMTAADLEVVVNGESWEAQLSGNADLRDGSERVVLSGSSLSRLDKFSELLSGLVGAQIEMTGTHAAPVTFDWRLAEDASEKFQFETRFGWDSASLDGFHLGAADVPIVVNEGQLRIGRTEIAAGEGRLIVDVTGEIVRGDLHLRVSEGRVAESIQLLDSDTQRWIERYAPPTAKLRNFNGKVSVDVDTATIVLNAPERSYAEGRVTLQESTARVQSVIRTDLLIAASENDRGVSAKPPVDSAGGLLGVTLPAQTIEIRVKRGMLEQGGVHLDVGGIPVKTEGLVSFDGWVSMIASIPRSSLNPATPSPDEKLYVFVSGNMFEPRIDPVGVGNTALLLRNQLKVGKEFAEQLHDVLSFMEEGRERSHKKSPLRKRSSDARKEPDKVR